MNSSFETSVHSLAKHFGVVQALINIELSIHASEAIILLGKNGAGKTTFLKLLALLTEPSQGEIRYQNKKVSHQKIDYKKNIGFAGHHIHLYQDLTIEENLQFFASLYQIQDKKNRTQEMIQIFNLEPYFNKRVRTLSRGLQQRADLARAFLHHPSLLLLDEPHAHLDQASSILLNSKLKEHVSQGKSFILSTHQSSISETLGTRWITFENGKKIYDGNTCVTDKYE